MSNWLSKSNVSFNIANNDESSLFNNNRVHCYYYGCVQYMFHVLHTDLEMDFQTIQDKCNPKVNVGNGGTHTWLHKFFLTNLSEKSHRLEGVDLNNSLGLLKKLRTDADYGYDDIDDDGLANAKTLCNKIQTILSKRYNNE